MKIDTAKLRSPQFIFIIYILAASLLIMIFRFIFPGTQAPLVIFSARWRLIQGVLEIFNLFPAIAFSALVIPFGLVYHDDEFQSFTEIFLKRLIVSVITAIAAAVIYGIIFFLALPMAKNSEENMRYKGDLYRIAKESAFERKDSGEWLDAYQFLKICYSVWDNSPELSDLKNEIEINLQRISFSEIDERISASAALSRDWRNSAEITTLSGETVNVTQALSMARAAFNENRFFDAHWLATLGGRIAAPGSPEAAGAAALASEAWNRISSLEPNAREQRLYQIYNLKLSGYQAMGSGDWIRAFYIFQELLGLTPDDPDAANFLAASERGAKQTAFFLEEIELAFGEILTGALFSLPFDNGRAVVRFSTLAASADIAYGTEFEYMEFDGENRLLINARSRYAKIIPFAADGRQQVLVLTHALDRNNKDYFYDSEWLAGVKTPGGIVIDTSYENLLLLANIRQGLANLQIDTLFLIAGRFSQSGYIQEIFQAEIINRIGICLFFLPMAIVIIIIGWRFRAKTRPRYLFFLMLPVLPVVFHGFVYLYRSVINIAGIWLVLSIGFSFALAAYIVIFALFLFASLIILASQKS